MQGRTLVDYPELVRAQFGGTPAPVFRLRYDGDRVTIAPNR
jgi:levansucrase